MHKLAALLIAAAGAANPPSTEDALVANVATAKFVDTTTPNVPKGSQNAMIGVDPNTKGATAYGKTPAGTGLPAHWHSSGEYTVLLAGKGTLVLDGKKHEVSPGSYFVIPAKMVHQFTCAEGPDCLLLTRRGGPTDYNFVKQ
ncbi:MAG: cupin domain-containing protein [Myxococcales bacterium]|nr:cupin domain-containing protein [Myxococcales bacterium]